MTAQIPPVVPTPAPRPQPYDVLKDMVLWSGMQATFATLSAIAEERAAGYRAANKTYYADCWEDMQREINDMMERAPRL